MEIVFQMKDPFRITSQQAETLHCTCELLSCNEAEGRRRIVIFISSQKVLETLLFSEQTATL